MSSRQVRSFWTFERTTDFDQLLRCARILRQLVDREEFLRGNAHSAHVLRGDLAGEAFEFGTMLRGQWIARIEQQYGGPDGAGGLGAETVVGFRDVGTELVERDHTDKEEHPHPEWEHDPIAGAPWLRPYGGPPVSYGVLRVVINDAVEHSVACPELSVGLRYLGGPCVRLRRDVAPLGGIRH